VYMATNDPSAGTLVYSGSRVNSFSIPMEYNRTYSLKVVVGKSNSANSWIQGVGSSLNAKNYSANYENFPSGEFLLKDGVNTKAGVFFTKYNITGTNFSAPSSFASNKKFLAINNTNALSITDISSRGYLSKSNFFEDYKLNYANCTSSNNVSGAINSDECFTPSSGDTITVTGALTPGPNSRNFYFDAPVVKISSNIKKPGASQNKSLPLFVVKNDLIIDSTVTSLEGIFLVGGSVVFNTGGTNQNDEPIVIEGSIIAKKDIIVYRDGLYNLVAQNNTLPIVRVDYLPRFLLDANFNYLREYSVSIFSND
ncbi:hypothetical protein KA001_01265, partial [Patescibacteria group bacterium]|nr:hypothetical protein [Patescibacteria group bacterium]